MEEFLHMFESTSDTSESVSVTEKIAKDNKKVKKVFSLAITGSEHPKPFHNNHSLLAQSPLTMHVCINSFVHEICNNHVTVNHVLLILIKVR